MDNTKYGKYVVRKSVTKPEPWPTMEWIGETDYNTNVTFMITRVMEPCEMEEYPHSHDFDMYLHFISYDSDSGLVQLSWVLHDSSEMSGIYGSGELPVYKTDVS